MRTLFRILKRIFYALLCFLVIFLIYFIIVVRVPEPNIADKSALNNTREKISDTFFKTKNGWLKKNRAVKSSGNLWELYVEGNGFERGVANGILTKELHEFQEDAFISQIQILVPNLNYLKFLKYFVAWFNRDLSSHIIDEYKEEIYGVSQFASDKYDFIASKYHRILNYHGAHDIGHALQDKNLVVGCTSFSIWDKKSTDGKLLVGRNFDFYSGDDFAKNKIVQFTNPTNGFKFVTITWPGFLGACSGMNEKGITVTINAAKSDIPTNAATPIALLAREILQFAKNIDEAIKIAEKKSVFVSESILVGSSSDNKTVSIEKTPNKMDVYEVPNSDQIICPNHYQGKDFATELTNLTNMNESSSIYRKFRLQQLLDRYPTISYLEAAAVLRNRFGINDKDLGFNNEKSLNQLIAHHAVIFKPADGLMWVSVSPYQLGEFVCYDINKVFKNYQNLTEDKKISSDSLNIPEDLFLKSKQYQEFLKFKYLKQYIQFITKATNNIELRTDFENDFVSSNPQSYITYEILGNYYLSRKNSAKAIEYFEKALSKEIATLKEKRAIEEKLLYCKTSH